MSVIQQKPGYKIIHHPRRFSKPLSCRSGIHKGLQTKFMNGVLFYPQAFVV